MEDKTAIRKMPREIVKYHTGIGKRKWEWGERVGQRNVGSCTVVLFHIGKAVR